MDSQVLGWPDFAWKEVVTHSLRSEDISTLGNTAK